MALGLKHAANRSSLGTAVGRRAPWLVLALVPLWLAEATAQESAIPTANSISLASTGSTKAVDCFLRLCGRTNRWGDVKVEPIEKRISDAEQGDINAELELALRFRDGAYAPKEAAEAVKWFRRAAIDGNIEAARFLSVSYRFGESRNIPEALRWLRFAAERGHLDSQSSLAFWLESGGGGNVAMLYPETEKNLPEAAKWYKRAALQGDAGAQLALGRMYARGEGVIQDFIEAYKWLNIAAASARPSDEHLDPGMQEALKRFPALAEQARATRNQVASQMLPSQLAEAQRLSGDFVPRKETQAPPPSNAKEPIADGSKPPLPLASPGTDGILGTLKEGPKS